MLGTKCLGLAEQKETLAQTIKIRLGTCQKKHDFPSGKCLDLPSHIKRSPTWTSFLRQNWLCSGRMNCTCAAVGDRFLPHSRTGVICNLFKTTPRTDALRTSLHVSVPARGSHAPRHATVLGESEIFLFSKIHRAFHCFPTFGCSKSGLRGVKQ